MARQLAAALVVLAVVFGAGVVTGRASVAPPSAVPTDAPRTPEPGEEGMPIALGDDAVVGPWSVRVDDVVLEGTEEVLGANQFNTPPPAGSAYVLVDVVVGRRTAGPAVLRGGLDPVLVTPVGGRYPLGTGCGVLRRPLDVQQPLGRGQELAGQWCWVVPDHDVPKVALRIAPDTGDAVWLALR